MPSSNESMLRTMVCSLPSITCFTSSNRVGGTGGGSWFASVVALLTPIRLRLFFRNLRLRVSFSDVTIVSLSHFVLSALCVQARGCARSLALECRIGNKHKIHDTSHIPAAASAGQSSNSSYYVCACVCDRLRATLQKRKCLFSLCSVSKSCYSALKLQTLLEKSSVGAQDLVTPAPA